jgi:YidC/Oxa1 family membrane protein insertase
MDQKRLPLFIAISFAILLLFQYLSPRKVAPPPVQHSVQASAAGTPASPGAPGAPATRTTPAPANAPRVTIDAPRVLGSISLLGARLDDLRLRDYHDTVARNSPLVRILEPLPGREPSSVQFGWSSTDGVKVPDDGTVWTSSGGDVTAAHPVTLSWDNGAGLHFRIELSVDQNYMFAVSQSVQNTGSTPVQVWPWQRVRRDYQPATAGYSVLFEGLMARTDFQGVWSSSPLHTMTYAATKSAADKADGAAYAYSGTGSWGGFTDKYWLTAVFPDPSAEVNTSWNHNKDDGTDHYQVSYVTTAPEKLAPGATAAFASHVFAGAKEVHLLDRYETQMHIPLLSYAVDWGHLWFLTKPFFYALDWLFSVFGNFGVAILVFTLGVKALFYPIAARSYRQMGKMRLLGPKVQQVRERYKDDPAKLQSEMMMVYKAENVNPVSGCAPMLLQIPVFFALYKVILVTIEMRQAPFFGWIQDLSATDPTNIFNLFGLIPFDPSALSPMLHLGVWPLIMGATMYLQQKLNPPPPDPTQARMLQFMPLIFMFSMGRFPAGLVIYWSWNNTLTMAQQWYIQRQAKLGPAAGAKAKVARS